MAEVVEKVRMDKSGRIIIPAKIRKKLGLKEDKLIAIATSSRLIIRKVSTSDGEIEKWYKKMLKTKIVPKKIKRIGDKWIDEEYARRKLGM